MLFLWIKIQVLKKSFPIIILYSVLIICILIYCAGLNGDFLFDDYPNLEPLGNYGVINSFDKVRAFVGSGFAGPTGRPVSLASFLIDANTWPTDPYPFKYTNLMVHLLNGLLLCWTILLLLKNYAYEEQKVLWIALLTTSLWLLHPYMVSTTLYIVQRMAQLATLFSLVGIVGYLKAREAVETRPVSAYLGMSIAIGAATILATFSKENGALLPLLILVIEFCNPNKKGKPIWQWRAIFLWLPSIAIAIVMLRYVDFSASPWPHRNFNQIERLFTEARIVSEYLFNLYVPRIELNGLYQDGYKVSKGLLQPINTLFSILFLSLLLISAFISRKKYPLFSLSIFFFFAAHLMESTTIGLELYFEHRNYLAALFLFLPIASGLYHLQQKVDPKLVMLIVTIILGILCFFTHERAKLWGDSNQLQLYWAQNSPNSPRAKNAIAGILMKQGRTLEANKFLEKAIQEMPDSALLNLQLLLQKLYANNISKQDFLITAERLERQSFDAQAMLALRILVDHISDNKQELYADLALNLVKSMDSNSNYNISPVFKKLSPYLKAKIYVLKHQPDLALRQYLRALSLYQDVETGMRMVVELGSAGYTHQALIIFEEVKRIYHSQPKSKLTWTQKEYNFEIERIDEVLKEDLNNTDTQKR